MPWECRSGHRHPEASMFKESGLKNQLSDRCLDAIVLEGGGEKGSDVYSTYPVASGHDAAFCIKREGGDERCHRQIGVPPL